MVGGSLGLGSKKLLILDQILHMFVFLPRSGVSGSHQVSKGAMDPRR